MTPLTHLKDPRNLGDYAVFVVIIIVITWASGAIRDSNRAADRKVAIRQAVARAVPAAEAANDRRSQARSVGTCQRANPTRAYLQVRAQEFNRTTTMAQSYTTKISPMVTAILNCEETVRNGGEPIPLSRSASRQYLKLFKAGYVPITAGDKILASIPFDVYFSGKYRVAPHKR